MSNFAPKTVYTPYHFEITENARGYWVAKDTQGLIGGVFRSQKDALRFALFEVAALQISEVLTRGKLHRGRACRAEQDEASDE